MSPLATSHILRPAKIPQLPSVSAFLSKNLDVSFVDGGCGGNPQHHGFSRPGHRRLCPCHPTCQVGIDRAPGWLPRNRRRGPKWGVCSFVYLVTNRSVSFGECRAEPSLGSQHPSPTSGIQHLARLASNLHYAPTSRRLAIRSKTALMKLGLFSAP